ncbi:MAG: RHS repeat-associated core domain-containing protein, partial [Verrucomicrobia bacterium]|nr:RHS repeat-associated core domain-containing protein [Verrucomicrobiota bacterium]
NIVTPEITKFTRGNKFFELSNHLGNVLATISDKHVQVAAPGNTVVDYYTAELITATDYYPFGMTMPGRKYSSSSSSYRFGYNGKENDNEIKGDGNSIDYGERTYDPRLGRFLSTDPLSRSFPWYTPYQYAGNNPILFIDIDGLEPITPQQFSRTVAWLVSNKPMYIGNFKRIHYELFTRRVYYGEGSLNKTEQNKLRGAIGEVVFAGRATIGFLPYHTTTYSFNKDQSATSSLRHDVKLTLTPVRAAQKPGEKGVTEPFSKTKITWDPAIEFNNVDGSGYKYLTDKKNQTTLYVEVKTLGVNSYNFTNIVDGFDQAIKTATSLKGQKNSLSVLAIDSDAYMNAIKDPAQLGIFTEKLAELKLAGGHLMLINNQYKKTEKETNSATEKAKDDAKSN